MDGRVRGTGSRVNSSPPGRAMDVMEGGNLALIDELVSDDFVDHNPMPGQSPSKDGVEFFVNTMRAASALGFHGPPEPHAADRRHGYGLSKTEARRRPDRPPSGVTP